MMLTTGEPYEQVVTATYGGAPGPLSEPGGLAAERGWVGAAAPTAGEPGLPDFFFRWLLENCAPDTIEALRSGTWAGVGLTWPRLSDDGATQLFFLGRPDGPKLWVVYH